MPRMLSCSSPMKTMLLASPLALGVALAYAPANAQATLTPSQRAALSQTCLELLDTASYAPGSERGLIRRDAERIAMENVDAQCVVAVRLIREEASDADRAAMDRMLTERERVATDEIERTETMTESVEVEQEARIEGEVAVEIPRPQVDVDQPAPTVEVSPGRVSGMLRHGGGEIVVRQPQPNIAVEMPAPTIRIEMPAPEVFVRLADPSLALDRSMPQVEVRQAEPRVTVRQGQPELDVDLDVNAEADARDTNTRMPEEAGVRRTTSEDGNVTITRRDATVQLRESEMQPEIAMERADPSVSFEQAEPTVSFNMAEANVEFMRVGEVRVTYETETEREARLRDGNGSAAANSGEMAASSANAVGDGMAMTAGELEDHDIYNAEGENLGDAERLVRHRGGLMLIMGHGGFLGLGDKEVALPLERVSMRGDRLVVEGLTEEEIEQMQDVDIDNLEVVSTDEEIRINRVR